MAVSDFKAVMEFLRNHGFADTELALVEDITKKAQVESFDFERFVFPMAPPPRPAVDQLSVMGDENRGSESTSGSDDEFVSLCSSATDDCSSEFTNPYGLRAATHALSDSSSDRLSQFGTARAYTDFDMQNDMYIDEDNSGFLSPFNGALDLLGCPSEDKFVMTSSSGRPCNEPLMPPHHLEDGFEPFPSINYLDKPCLNEFQLMDFCSLNEKVQLEKGVNRERHSCLPYDCPKLLCECGSEKGASHCVNCDVYRNCNDLTCSPSKIQRGSLIEYDSQLKPLTNQNSGSSPEKCSTNDQAEESNCISDFNARFAPIDFQMDNGFDAKGSDEETGLSPRPEARADEEEDVAEAELPMSNASEDEHDVFYLKIIHRKNRTGFEENKDFPIVLNSMIGGRYYVTEYLGSAAFSKVVQAHDIQTGVDVCLKIIKNDKDFFDQSLDEIKLLKLVNKHDPLDERHLLRLYDYFYHQEHLFIVCELLRANLYEFQKFNQESGGKPYFTLSRLQVITRQCLEALEYLHQLRIIHCDLKPENILMKSYRRCEIKIIDLGSSCFQTDNLCLYVQSRSYRAPEVILGLPYDGKIDIWSLGCILAELCSGEVLFPNDALVWLLARIIGLLGPMDLAMLVKGRETEKYFTKEYELYHINEETNEVEYIIPESSSLEQQLRVLDVGFVSFVRELLEINPERRPSAREAMDHPWLLHPYHF